MACPLAPRNCRSHALPIITCNWRSHANPRTHPAGWDLAVKLLRPKNDANRGRLSCAQALRHPFLLLPA